MIVLAQPKVKRYYTAYIPFIEIKYQITLFFMKVHHESTYENIRKNTKKPTNVSFISAPDKT